MKLPRDLDAPQLIRALERIGYRVVRQTGSHVRLQSGASQLPALTIPNHSPLKVGTLSAILGEVATRLEVSREQLLDQLFG